MCGIAGVAGPQWNDPERLVKSMLDVLEHRGPDDFGICRSGSAVLGVRRLSIIDVAGGHQPMSGENDMVTAVQNGELYTFRGIRDDLIARGHVFRTQSDTEILPHAYEEHGPEMFRLIRGMWAVAIWDARRHRLVLSRDRLGKKPLFYARVGDGVAFASEIQALLAIGVPTAVDDDAIAEYLRLGYILAPRTGFAAIRRLGPAETLTFEQGRTQVQRYWEVPAQDPSPVRVEEAAAQLRELIDDAVRIRLISDVPIGAFLSGGLDSSTVVESMARLSSGRVRTFSIGFPDQDFSELRYAKMVADRFDTDHTEFVVQPSAVDVLPMLVRHLGDPFADSSIVPTYYVARTARPHVTVALNGDGGDEIFAGYERYRAAWLAARLDGLPLGLRRQAARLADMVPDRAGIPRQLRRARRFVRTLAEAPEHRYFGWHGYFTTPEILGERLRESPSASRWPSVDGRGGRDIVARLMRLDLETYLPGDLLVKMDIASMAASVEPRSPLLDHRLVEFMSRLPTDLKMRRGQTKFLLRWLMRDVLPHEILGRRKMGFSIPVSGWLRGPLRGLVEDTIVAARDRGYVDQAVARELAFAQLDGRADRPHLVWALLMLELWFRHVVEARWPAAARAA